MTTTAKTLLKDVARVKAHCLGNIGRGDLFGAMDRIEAHILATVRADDDEPLDAAWLDDRALRCSDGVVANWYFGPQRFIAVTSHRETADMFLVTVAGWERPHIKTRGEVRRLCAALGIPQA